MGRFSRTRPVSSGSFEGAATQVRCTNRDKWYLRKCGTYRHQLWAVEELPTLAASQDQLAVSCRLRESLRRETRYSLLLAGRLALLHHIMNDAERTSTPVLTGFPTRDILIVDRFIRTALRNPTE